MIEPKLAADGRLVIGPCRLAFVHLLEKTSFDDGQEGKYEATLLIPKSEIKTIKVIKVAIAKAREAAIVNKWRGKDPGAKCQEPLRDGDESNADGFANHYTLRAKTKTRLKIIDRNQNLLTDDEEVYSGMYALVSVSFFGYDVSGNKGIGVALNNVMKTKDGERFSGQRSAADELAGISLDDDDDDL